MNTEDIIRKKYRLSLLYLLKDLLLSAVIGGVIGVVFFNILFFITNGFAINKELFFETFIYCYAIGAIVGLIRICLKDDNDFGGNTDIALYNTYAGIHNTFLFANAGDGYSYDATFSLLGLLLSLLGLVYKLGCAIVVVPMSIVYLCIMSIFETIFNGIPVTLGNILDKIIPLISKLCGMVAVIVVLVLMNV